MEAYFDAFNRFEVPKFALCRPGSIYNSNGTITGIIGTIPETYDEELVANFNEVSELNFRVYKIRADQDTYSLNDTIYAGIKNRCLIFVDDIGFFVVTDTKEESNFEGTYKDITAKSCEIEIENRTMPASFYDPEVSGYDVETDMVTISFGDLLNDIVAPNIPIWTVGTIDSALTNKVRTFENISEDTNLLSFLMSHMQDAYECVFEFNIKNRTISAYDQENYVTETNIYLSNDDLISSIQISENSDDIYTALNVKGNNEVTISAINPLGTNVIYDFSYYLDWMSDSLKTKVNAWAALVSGYLTSYYNYNLTYYTLLKDISDLNSDIDKCDTQLSVYNKLRDNIIAESGLANTSDKWKLIASGDTASSILNTVNTYNSSAEGATVVCYKQYLDSLTVSNNTATTTYKAIPYTGVTTVGHEISKLYSKSQSGVYENEFTQVSTTPTATKTFSYNPTNKVLTFYSGDASLLTHGIVAVYYQETEADENDVVVISDLIDAVDSKIATITATKTSDQTSLTTKTAQAATAQANVAAIQTAVDMETYFGSDMDELNNYIFEGSYTDEYVTYTDSMDYTEKFSQMKILYDRAVPQLARVSTPTEEFDLDVENFIFQSNFSDFTSQLKPGCSINVEIRPEEIVNLFLSGFTVNYSDESLSMKFGSKLNRYDTKSLFEDVLGNIKRTANTLQFIKNTVYPIKAGELDSVKEELSKSRLISAGQALASTGNEVVIDDGGYTGRAKLDDGEYSDEQIKIVNNMIALTDDAWDTCKVAIGKIVLDEDTSVYGVNAETLIGDVIMGDELHILVEDAVTGETTDLLTVTDNKIESRVSETEDEIRQNYISYPYADTTKTENGITFTDNGDGSVTVNGTATADAYFTMFTDLPIDFAPGSYTLSGCPAGGGANKYALVTTMKSGSTTALTLSNYGTASTGTLSQMADNITGKIAVMTETTVSNLIFKPMLETGTSAHDWKTPVGTSVSMISQNAHEITLKVSNSDYTGNNIATKINDSSTTVTIDGRKLTVTSVTGDQIANTTITGSKIATGTIEANNIHASAITADKIDTGAVTAEKIATGAITAGMITTGTLESADGTVKIDLDNNTLKISNKNIDTSIASITTMYGISNSATTAPSSYPYSTVPTRSTGQYIWKQETFTPFVGTAAVKETCITGDPGSKGDKGDAGTSVTIASTGITYQASTSGTVTPTGTWSSTVPTVDKGKYLWTRTIVTYSDGTSTTAYSVAYVGTNGAKGDTGDKGDTGNGISSISYYYKATTTQTAPQASEITSTTMPTLSSTNKYLWQKEVVVFTDTSVTDKTTVILIAVYGDTGAKGDTGSKGDTGNGINSITYYYKATTTQTAPQASEITSTTMPSLSSTNKYLWQKEVIDFTDTSVEDKTTVILLAVYGDTGQSVYILSTGVTYQVSSSGTEIPTGTWSTSVPTVPDGQYLWTRTRVTYNNGISTTAYSVAYKGVDGVDGEKGDTGAQGISISRSFDIYYHTASTTGPTAPTTEITQTSSSVLNTWTKSCPSLSVSYPYVYHCTQYVYSDGTIGCSAVSLDPIASNMSNWCQANNTTLINGAKIDTGTIAATSIVSSSITASQLASNCITADKIKADETWTKKITASNLNITGGSVNITTSSDTSDLIKLKYGTKTSSMMPLQFSAQDSSGYRMIMQAGGLFSYNTSNAAAYIGRNSSQNGGRMYLCNSSGNATVNMDGNAVTNFDYIVAYGNEAVNVAASSYYSAFTVTWQYRKWASGRKECSTSFNIIESSYASMGDLYAFYVYQLPFPSNFFTSGTYPVITYSGQVAYQLAISGGTLNSSYSAMNPYLLSYVSGSQSVTYRIYAIGR